MSEISVVVVGSTSINSVVGNGDTVNVNVGNQTAGGGNGAAATIEAGTVTTIDATQTATVTNVGTAYAAKFNFSLPRGSTGSAGPANSLSISKVSTGATAAVSISGNAPSQTLSFVLQPGPANSLSIGSVSTGTTAAVSISGAAPSQSLSFVLPQGPAGPISSLKIGTVVSGSDASATITGTAPTQTLNLVLPQGATGERGLQGDVGPSGPPNSLTVGSVTTTSESIAAVSITGNAPSQQISFVVPRGPQGVKGDAGPYTTVQAGTVTTGDAGSSAKVDAVTSGGTVTLNFTIPRGSDGTSNLGDETPRPLGSASAGSAWKAARADHVHPLQIVSYTALTNVPGAFVAASHTHTISEVQNLQAVLDGKQASGSYATLVNGLVPSSQLPGFVDDIVEAANYASLPQQGESGKLYVAVDTRKLWRWSGSAYVEIASSPGSTDSVTEGTTNLYFTTKRAADASPVQSVNGKIGNVTIEAGGIAWSTAPTATTTTTKAGQIAYSSDYLFVATNSDTWRRATIEDWTAPTITITSQPANQGALAGVASFSVTATATQGAELTYQWQRQAKGVGGWSNITNALSTVLSLTGLSYLSNDGDKYRVIITAGSAGTGGTAVDGWLPAVASEMTSTASATSDEATLTVGEALVITSQPQPVTLTSGTSASFAVTAYSPGAAATYQWQSSTDGASWANISGATSQTLSLTGITESDYSGKRYRCVVSASGYSSVNSNSALLTVQPISVTSQPASVTATAEVSNTPSYSASFTVAATSPSGPPTIQWEVSSDSGVNFSDISGATSATLNVVGLTSGDNGKRYRARLQRSGWTNVLSSDATVTIPPATISITQQPTNTTATSSAYSATSFTLPEGTWNAVSVANGLWFATPNDVLGGDYLATSSDGLTWTKRLDVLPRTGKWSKVVYGNGVYLSVLSLGNALVCAYSTDAVVWNSTVVTLSGFAAPVDASDVFFLQGGGGWFFIAQTNRFFYSRTGSSWTTSSFAALIQAGNIFCPSSDGSSILSIASANSPTIAVVTSSGVGDFASSASLLPPNVTYTQAIHDGTRYVVCGIDGTAGFTATQAPNGSWAVGTFASRVRSIAYRDGRYVALTDSGIASSNDGINWSLRQAGGAALAGATVTAVEKGFVANSTSTSSSLQIFYTSQDGLAWTNRGSSLSTFTAESQVIGNRVIKHKTSSDTGWIVDIGGLLSATFSAAATTSFGAPSVQWQKSLDGGATWANISGETSPSLTFAPLFGDNGTRYRSVFSKPGFASVTSNAATLTADVSSAVITISSQPAAATASFDGAAAFSVIASATLGATISYQWERANPGSTSFAAVSGATGRVISLTGLTTPADSGAQYRCVVSATGGATTTASASATLTVTPPIITLSQQPTPSVVAFNGAATFSAAATVTKNATISYQWERKQYGVGDFVAITGATSSTLSLTGLTVDNSADVYRVAVSATGGAVTIYSNTCTATYPTITVLGMLATATSSAGAITLSATASSSVGVTVSYQWQKRENGAVEFANISGATSSQLSLTGLTNQADNGDAYRVVVSGIGGAASVTSVATTLVVPLPVITITQQPSAQTASGGSAAFSVTATATNAATLSYQWQRSAYGAGEFVNISGGTSATLSLSGLTNAANNGDLYRVVVAATGGATSVTSASASLLVPVPSITITSQPSSQVASSGSATLSVTAVATLGASVSYQWQRQQAGVGGFANVQGATGSTLALTGLTNVANNGDVYQAVVSASGAASSVTSGAATVTVPSPVITISTQPVAQTASSTGTASFSVSAGVTAGATILYQWQKQESGSGGFANISGATSATLSLSGLTYSSDNGDVYRVVLSSSDGAAPVTSLSAALSVQPPVITVQSASPSDSSVAEGGIVTLVVYSSVTAGSVLSYQWQKQESGVGEFVNVSDAGYLSGATIESLSLYPTSPSDSGDKYRCIVSATGGAASVTSRAATVTIVSAPVISITSQPTTQQAASNAATFSVTATATNGATLSYQWQKQEGGIGSFSNVAGATSRTLPLTGLTSASDDNDWYRVVVSATGGATSVISQAAKLSFAAVPVISITSQPSSQSAAAGAAAFSVSATVTQGATLSYQWQKREAGALAYADVPGATSSTLSLSGLSPAFDNGDSYRVAVSATGGAAQVTSSDAILTVTPTPYIVITSHPAARTASGGAANFAVTASTVGSSTLSYQWQKQESGTGPFADITNATASTLSVFGLTAVSDNGDVYRVVVSGTNGAASVTSNSATLTVPLPVITVRSQPQSVLTYSGVATFSVIASISYGSLRYQWRKREAGGSTFADVAGATSSILSLSGLTTDADNGDSYCVVISAEDGSGVSVTSDAATLNAPVPNIEITEQPRDFVSLTGSALLSTGATATNFALVSYQWQIKKPGASSFTNIPSATRRTLELAGLTAPANDQDTYRAVISASGAPTVFSRTATLSVPMPYLSITYQPTLQFATYGAATFLVSATASQYSTLSYQWQKQEGGVGGFSNIPDETSATLSRTDLRHAYDNGDVYRVIVTATAGPPGATWSTSITSDPAPLVVADESGYVWAWGDNSSGQLGNYGVSVPPPPPANRLTGYRFAAVEAGGSHSLAITRGGGLLAWGLNGFGQLGIASAANLSRVPIFVGSATNWTAVSAGKHHSAGIAGGALYFWGRILGATSEYRSPTMLGTSYNWVSVACGNDTVLAINSSGELWGLGDNFYGQVGDGTTQPRQELVRIGSASNWSTVFAGARNTFAVTTTGQLWGWGYNATGGVGDGTLNQRTSPVRIGTASNWVTGAAGGGQSYAINSIGEMWGWGPTNGIGDGTQLPRVLPTQIGLGSPWLKVSARDNCAFATTAFGELWGWGYNQNGQLGDSSITNVLSPTRIGPQTNWGNVSVGEDFVAAITAW